MKQIEIQGIISDIDSMRFAPTKLVVRISNDSLCRSISILHEESGIAYQIPFEPVAKYLERWRTG